MGRSIAMTAFAAAALAAAPALAQQQGMEFAILTFVGSTAARASLDSSMSFSIANISAGNYKLAVRGGDAATRTSVTVIVNGVSYTLGCKPEWRGCLYAPVTLSGPVSGSVVLN